MGYQINYSYVADKNYWRKRVWKGGGGGVQMSGHMSVVSYSVHDY